MNKYLILDCYVDEPACLGVPPFISPYPRYIAGALIDAGTDPSRITYTAIDSLRETGYRIKGDYTCVFLVGGASVPGKYLGTKIGTLAEISRIIETNSNLKIAAGGVVNRALSPEKNLTIIMNDMEKYAHTFALGTPEDSCRTYSETDRWAAAGAYIVKSHPWYPHIICEMETGRGCPRSQHCSFCSEGLIQGVEFRNIRGIIDETECLIKQGVSRFRIGRQPDIIQYGSSLSVYKKGFPEPEPAAVEELFGELKKFRDSGDIEVLNVDNGNPGSIANWPDESARRLQAIARAVTPGDTLPFGIESFDENVVRLNNLKVNMEEAMFSLRMVNEICGARSNGIPVLLPGINLIQGLKGETADTFRINYDALQRIVQEGLMVKRINIRRLQPYPGTAIYDELKKTPPALLKRFEYYKAKIRDEIDNTMLKAIYPAGTILRRNLMLDYRDGYSLGKQVSSYSITVKVPGETGRVFSDIIVTGHRERSLAGITVPFNPNTAPAKSFESIPGIGRDRCSRIVLARPFSTADDFGTKLEGVEEVLKRKILDNTVL